MTVEVVILLILGLAGGSFANAAIWRIHKREQSKIHDPRYSILTGRSMCPNCHHQLKTVDLIPVISWLALKGKCRFCRQPISVQYPLVELLTATLFISSYIFWPTEISSLPDYLIFWLWLVQLVILVILAIYDIRWLILPDRLILILAATALSELAIRLTTTTLPDIAGNTAMALLTGGGLFYALFVFSNGRWIGGGDIKLGFYAGLSLGWPAALVGLMTSFYTAFFVTVPLLIAGKLNRKSRVPFGPFIILGIIVAKIFTPAITGYLAHYWF